MLRAGAAIVPHLLADKDAAPLWEPRDGFVRVRAQNQPCEGARNAVLRWQASERAHLDYERFNNFEMPHSALNYLTPNEHLVAQEAA